jgi:hypothetical protein
MLAYIPYMDPMGNVVYLYLYVCIYIGNLWKSAKMMGRARWYHHPGGLHMKNVRNHQPNKNPKIRGQPKWRIYELLGIFHMQFLHRCGIPCPDCPDFRLELD